MIRINVPRLIHAVRSKTSRDCVDLHEAAEKTYILDKGGKRPSGRAIFSHEQLSRVISTQPDTSISVESGRIMGGVHEDAPSVAYLVKNVSIVDGVVYGRAFTHDFSGLPRSLLIRGQKQYVEAAALSSSLYGSRFFGHWMTDDLPMEIAASQFADPIHGIGGNFRQEPDYRNAFGLKKNVVRLAQVGSLYILSDASQTSSKRSRYEQLRARLFGHIKTAARLVYIRRGRGGAQEWREPINLEEVEEGLRESGFEFVDPDVMTGEEIIQATLGAKVVVGVEGSHLSPAVYTLANDGCLFVLQSPYYFNNVFKDYTDRLDQRYAFMIGQSIGEDRKYSISLSEMFDILERIV